MRAQAPDTPIEHVVAELVSAPSVDDLARRCVTGLQPLLTSAVSFDLVEGDGHSGRTVAAVGVSDYFLARYEQLGRRHDPVLSKAVTTGRLADNRSLMSLRRWCSLPVYRDVFQLHRLTNVLYAPIMANGRAVATIDVGRGDHVGEFAPDEIDLVQDMARAASAAYASLEARTHSERERLQLRAALDACDEAVVVTDPSAGSRRLNTAAQRLLSRLAEGAPALDDILARTKDAGAVAESSVALASGGEAVLLSRSTPLEGQPGVVISVLELHAPSERLAAIVEASLTLRERQVAMLVVRGLRDAEIAEELVISAHTVKHHLKSIYRKLGVRSRLELASLAR